MPASTRRQFAATLAGAAAARAADDPLKTLKRSRPRIVIDAAGLERVRALVRSEPLPKAWYEAVRADAAELLKKPPSQYEIPDGKRLLATSRRVKERVQTLGLVYRLEGDRACRDRVWAEVEAAARFKDWNPSHFLDTAEMTYAFAVAYDWLYADWTEAQRRTMREAIVRLGLTPGMKVYGSAKGWHTNENNWNQVCNGGLTAGALAIAEEEPALARQVLENALRSVPLAMKHYAPDGGGTEGATYWGYGSRFNILMIASLEAALGTDFGLSATPGFADSGLYQMYMGGAGRVAFNFADCGLNRLSTPMHFWMARRFRRPEFSWYRYSALAESAGDAGVLDLLWYDPSGRDYDPARLPLDRHFRGAESAAMRGSWKDPNAVLLAIQAGDNNKLSGHRHLDLGSFILDAMGERWVMDSGVDHETYQTHRNRVPRPDFYRIRAEGHNTLVINPDRGPDQKIDAVAKMVRFGDGTAVVDLSDAYAGKARRVTRTFDMKDRKAVVVTDRVEAEAPVEMWWFAHTEAEVKLDASRRRATLSRHGKRFEVQLLAPAGAVFEVREAVPLPTSPNPEVQEKNTGRRKLAVRLTGVRETELAVRFGGA